MATYHTIHKPPRVAGVCDEDGTPLVQREDDMEETVRRRIVVYNQNTQALVEHYRAQGLLRQVSGTGDIETIYTNMIQVLGQAGTSC